MNPARRMPGVRRAARAALALLVTAAPLALADEGAEALIEAVGAGDAARVATMLDAHPRLVSRPVGGAGWTPLHRAVADRDTAMVQLLLGRGASVKSKGSQGETPLHSAMFPVPGDSVPARRARVVTVLLDAGAAWQEPDRHGVTPLHWGAVHDNVDGVRQLLARGADVNVVARKEKWTPLHGAANTGSPELVRLLLDAGASLTARDRAGRTPLGVARMLGRTETVALLVERGAKE